MVAPGGRSVGKRPVRRAIGSFAAISLVLTGCSTGSTDAGGDAGRDAAGALAADAPPSSIPGTLPLAEQALDDPDVTTVASELAPSQVSGSTVPKPATPGPCIADDLELWTAQVRRGVSTADAVIRMRNVSDTWCEPDLGRSPRLDPAIEPDVWLLPDGTADVIVAQAENECATPSVVTSVQIAVDRESVFVPTAVVTCGWWLSAFYPNEPVTEACSMVDLELAVTDSAVLVRNSSPTPCRLGGLVSVDGAAVVAAGSSEPGQPVHELLWGDVVAFRASGGAGCEGPDRQVLLVDAAAGAFLVEGVPCGIVFELGPPRAWYGSADGPLSGTAAGPLEAEADVEAVLDALDPFDRDE